MFDLMSMLGPQWAPQSTGTLDWEALLAMLRPNPGIMGMTFGAGAQHPSPWTANAGSGMIQPMQLQAPPNNEYKSGGGMGGGSMFGKGGGQTRGNTGGVSMSDTVRSST